MTREEVFSLIQAHLADELEVDPARIDDATRFREDLQAVDFVVDHAPANP